MDKQTQAAQIAAKQIKDGTFVSGAAIARNMGLDPDTAEFHWVALAATRAAMR